MTDDLLSRAQAHLVQCGSCDAGLPMSCTHPSEDYRPVLLDLVREVERLRRVGICGNVAPSATESAPHLVCDLPAGHDGWHGADNHSAAPAGYIPSRCSWGLADPPPEEAESMDLLLWLNSAEQGSAWAHAEVGRLERERDEARAEVERTRLVVEAAETWRDAKRTIEIGEATDDLVAAVDAYRTAPPDSNVAERRRDQADGGEPT